MFSFLRKVTKIYFLLVWFHCSKLFYKTQSVQKVKTKRQRGREGRIGVSRGGVEKRNCISTQFSRSNTTGHTFLYEKSGNNINSILFPAWPGVIVKWFLTCSYSTIKKRTFDGRRSWSFSLCPVKNSLDKVMKNCLISRSKLNSVSNIKPL